MRDDTGDERDLGDRPAIPRRYQFSVRMEPEMVRGAAVRYMWRRLKWRYVLGWIGAGFGGAVYSATDLGLLTAAVGALAVLLGLVLVALPVSIWFAIRRTVEGYAQLTGGAPVAYEVDDEWLISHYALGSGELHWSAFKGVLKTDEAWLLLMAHEDRFIPLPVKQVPEETLQFIEQRVATRGGV
ncbi:MAG: YcxB family protein [Armatimonadota bacterium]|jgi:hypothetical protein